jgi:hypothetical protein
MGGKLYYFFCAHMLKHLWNNTEIEKLIGMIRPFGLSFTNNNVMVLVY